jgi:hypothetical protein
MRTFLIPLLAFSTLAGPAAAETRYLAYDASDRVTQALTRGITLEADRGLFGAIGVRRIISTSNRGSADIRRGGPDAVRQALPAGSTEYAVYTITPEGAGRGLSHRDEAPLPAATRIRRSARAVTPALCRSRRAALAGLSPAR